MEKELLKDACEDLQEKLKNLDTEVEETLDVVNILLQGTEDGGLKCVLNLIGSKLKRIEDISMLDVINSLVDLEAGIIMDKEEQVLGELPGLKMKQVMSSEGDIVDIDEKPKKKRSYRKKSEESLDDIFSNDEDLDNFMKVQ
jgi:hypothetical protein